jgi:hypothetical protein
LKQLLLAQKHYPEKNQLRLAMLVKLVPVQPQET